ncbi:unnamed protein product [Prorocentrum cordatum]|uniref:JmjC domain-containing protein n=1 Tax=Prorocentrum cordatum TaxID=2364126 RepID=A0ABN9V4K7_9DINO|nr:unnamed protein product [Polarella glacialis]
MGGAMPAAPAGGLGGGWAAALDAAKLKVRSELTLDGWRKYGFASARAAEFEALRAAVADCSPPGAVPREACANLTVEEFWDKYERRRLPCIISGVPEAEGWAAWTKWEWPDFFRRFAAARLKVGKDDNGAAVRVRVDDFERYMRADCAGDDSPVYLFDNKFQGVGEEFLKEFKVPSYFPDDYMAMAGEDDRPPYRWIGVGPRRSGTIMHTDPLCTSAWNTLIRGRKLWLLLRPSTPKKIAKGKDVMRKGDDDEAINHFLDLLPRKLAQNDPSFQPILCVQHPGDTIFVPGEWWHCVVNLDDTIAVTQNYCGRNNFADIWRSAREERPCWSHKWLRAMAKAQPSLVTEALRLNQQDGFDMAAMRDKNRARKRRQVERRDQRALRRLRARNRHLDEVDSGPAGANRVGLAVGGSVEAAGSPVVMRQIVFSHGQSVPPLRLGDARHWLQRLPDPALGGAMDRCTVVMPRPGDGWYAPPQGAGGFPWGELTERGAQEMRGRGRQLFAGQGLPRLRLSERATVLAVNSPRCIASAQALVLGAQDAEEDAAGGGGAGAGPRPVEEVVARMVAGRKAAAARRKLAQFLCFARTRQPIQQPALQAKANNLNVVIGWMHEWDETKQWLKSLTNQPGRNKTRSDALAALAALTPARFQQQSSGDIIAQSGRLLVKVFHPEDGEVIALDVPWRYPPMNIAGKGHDYALAALAKGMAINMQNDDIHVLSGKPRQCAIGARMFWVVAQFSRAASSNVAAMSVTRRRVEDTLPSRFPWDEEFCELHNCNNLKAENAEYVRMASTFYGLSNLMRSSDNVITCVRLLDAFIRTRLVFNPAGQEVGPDVKDMNLALASSLFDLDARHHLRRDKEGAAPSEVRAAPMARGVLDRIFIGNEVGRGHLFEDILGILALEAGPIEGRDIVHICSVDPFSGRRCCADRGECVDKFVRTYTAFWFGRSWPIPATARFTNTKINSNLVCFGFMLHQVLPAMLHPSNVGPEAGVDFYQVGVGMSDYQIVHWVRKRKVHEALVVDRGAKFQMFVMNIASDPLDRLTYCIFGDKDIGPLTLHKLISPHDGIIGRTRQKFLDMFREWAAPDSQIWLGLLRVLNGRRVLAACRKAWNLKTFACRLYLDSMRERHQAAGGHKVWRKPGDAPKRAADAAPWESVPKLMDTLPRLHSICDAEGQCEAESAVALRAAPMAEDDGDAFRRQSGRKRAHCKIAGLNPKLYAYNQRMEAAKKLKGATLTDGEMARIRQDVDADFGDPVLVAYMEDNYKKYCHGVWTGDASVAAGGRQKFEVLKDGLSNIVDEVGSKIAKFGELMLMVTMSFPHNAHAKYKHVFITCAVPTFRPRVQVWVKSSLTTDEVGSCPVEVDAETEHIALPFFLNLLSRPCLIKSDFMSLSELTGEDLALEIATAPGCRSVVARQLEYDVMEEIFVVKVGRVGDAITLWEPGQRAPYKKAPPPTSGLDLLPKGDPFAPRARSAGPRHAPPVPAAEGPPAPADEPEPNYEEALADIIDEAYRVAVEDGGDVENCFDQSEEALHAWEHGPDDIAWPAAVGAKEDGAIVQATGAVDEDEGGVGGPAPSACGASSSSGSPAPDVPPPAPTSPPTGGEGAVAVESDEVVLASLRWMPALEGGYVFRHGVCIGQLSQWKTSFSMRCYMHGCRHAVSQKVGERARALWLARGRAVPGHLSPAEKARAKATLKAEHLAWPKPRANMQMEFEEQVATCFRAHAGSQEFVAALPACKDPAVFAVCWAQATEHKGSWCDQGAPIARPMMIIPMEATCVSDPCWEHNVKVNWSSMRAVVVRLDVSKKALDDIAANLRDLQRKLWAVVAEADGRPMPPMPSPGRLVAVAEPLLLSKVGDRAAFGKGSSNASTKWHVDTKVVDGAPGLHHLQAAVLLKGFKECRGYTRVGCITSLYPPTQYIADNCNLSRATRFSQQKLGVVSKRFKRG